MNDEFFVGYLPTPSGLKKWLIGLLAGSLICSGVLAALIASGQRDPGSGVWDLSKDVTLQGRLIDKPYPMIWQAEQDKVILIVGAGKYGVRERIGSLGGKIIGVTGHLIQRDDWTMLEIGDDAKFEEQQSVPEFPVRGEGSPVTLRGEIYDPKCYLGSMKPGDGKTHKACATLCIRGGIPPVFGTRESGLYLLTDPDGNALEGESLEKILPFVADSIELQGNPGRVASIQTLAVDPASIVRR